MMRALRHHKEGGLKVEDAPKPATLGGNDVLIRVKATAVTRSELEWAETKARETPIPGHDVAGIIEVLHPNLSSVHIADKRLRPSATESQASDPATKSSLSYPLPVTVQRSSTL